MSAESPLGKSSEYPRTYAPEVLHAIPREGDRAAVPGVDIWNAWELTWLTDRGRPQNAGVEIRVPADSPNIVESKSLKLYLGSFAMSRFVAADEVFAAVRKDVGACVGSAIGVAPLDPAGGTEVTELPGTSLDDLDIDCNDYHPNAGLLRASGDSVTESLHSHSLRSLCPVTAQPDIGSVLVRYTGPQIDHASLLRYIVSYREHDDFHEACVERMFLDIRNRCSTEQLSVYARYQRRGGIDINPFRSDFETDPPNLRTWRQ
ncbi:MAG: NADPH-dependent 7-cyano-7-deazaguanine reductase QueF [Woeseiaceae bacterium]|nr:NADPH-dependent 7-cyano-7-deazaguanine reductase QueF [Woeseiaceae bacterium]